jgi:hypothetical protein
MHRRVYSEPTAVAVISPYEAIATPITIGNTATFRSKEMVFL